MYLLAIVKGMIITIKHLFTRKVTIHPEQSRTQSSFRGQHQLKRDEQGRRNCTACIRAYHEPAEAITMTAAERTDEKHLYREKKNMLRYMK
jgi:NADH-quinone oxidoreductase subunit I